MKGARVILFNGLFAATVFCYALSSICSFRYYQSLDASLDKPATRWLLAGFILQCAAFLGLWAFQGFAPLASLEGILLALSLSLAAAILTGRIKTPVPLLASLFMPFIFFLSLLTLLAGLKGTPLMDSHLMTTGMACHILMTFLGFAHFTLGFGVGIAFWVQEGQLKAHRIKSWSFRLPALETLDRLTVYYIGLGFLFWLGGLALGTYQAFEVWNRLPLADPKILGSLLVLLIYACFFLLRWGFKMRGRKTMALVLAGYFLALFTFVGVRILLLNTQHAF
jgi:HemX protein